MQNIPALAFTIKYDGVTNRLITPARVIVADKDVKTSLAQWDTGATGTCVSHRIITALGAVPCAFNEVHTPSGKATMPMYIVDIELPNHVTCKNIAVMESEIGQQGIDLLIGMDIISIGDFSVTTERRPDKVRTCFSFRIPSLSPIDYVKISNECAT